MKMLARAALALSALFLWTPLAAHAAGPVLAYPTPTYLDGTEQMLILQGGGWKIINFNQLKSWASSGSIPAPTLGPTGHTLAYPTVTSLDGTEEFLLFQNGGWKVYGLGQLRSWLTGSATATLVTNGSAPVLGYPSVSAVDGTEQFAIFQDGRWEDCTFAYLQSWAGLSGGVIPTPTAGTLDFSDPNQSAFIL